MTGKKINDISFGHVHAYARNNFTSTKIIASANQEKQFSVLETVGFLFPWPSFSSVLPMKDGAVVVY